MTATKMTKAEFEALKRQRGVQCETERDVEFWYETLTDEDGNELAFASYRTGHEPTYTRR